MPKRILLTIGTKKGVGVGFSPQAYPEFGQCVHKIAPAAGVPGRLYMQNHGGFPDLPGVGVMRSDDHGRSWRPIVKGLPIDFGFPIVAHPKDPDTVYVMPHEPETRTRPKGAPAVWRSRDGGESWECLFDSLPPVHCVKVAIV